MNKDLSRREFVNITAAAFAAMATTGEVSYAAKARKPAAEAPNDFGVCYGSPVAQSDFKKFDEMVVEPGHYTKMAHVPTNAIAYVALDSLYHDNKAQILLEKNIQKAGGWLGAAPSAANAKAYIDLRNPQVREAMKAHVLRQLDKGYKGVFLDSIDAFAASKEPGLREAAVNFVKDMSATLKRKKPKAKIILNGGLDDTHHTLRELAPHIDAVACVDQAVKKATAHDFTLGQMKEAMEARGKTEKAFEIYPIELDTATQGEASSMSNEKRKKLMEDVAQYWENLGAEIKQAGDAEVHTPYGAPDAAYQTLNLLPQKQAGVERR